MALSKPVKVLVGLATSWPLLYMLAFFAFIFFSLFAGEMGSFRHDSGPPKFFKLLFLLHLLTILWIFGLFAFYLVYLFKTDRVAPDKKALWAVVLFLGNMIAMPIFFMLYVWPDRPLEAEPPNPAAPR